MVPARLSLSLFLTPIKIPNGLSLLVSHPALNLRHRLAVLLFTIPAGSSLLHSLHQLKYSPFVGARYCQSEFCSDPTGLSWAVSLSLVLSVKLLAGWLPHLLQSWNYQLPLNFSSQRTLLFSAMPLGMLCFKQGLSPKESSRALGSNGLSLSPVSSSMSQHQSWGWGRWPSSPIMTYPLCKQCTGWTR